MKIFISGSREIDKLNDDIFDVLYIELNANAHILVGDAEGVDSEIQRFCKNQDYKNVTVFAVNGKARNNIGNFNVKNIEVSQNVYFKAAYIEKDKAMTDAADYGIAIWDGKSKGSLNNILRLIKQNKPCRVYLFNNKKWIWIENENALKNIQYPQNLENLNNAAVQLSFVF